MNNYTTSCSAWELHMRGSPLVGPLIVCREYLKEASRCMIQEGHHVRLEDPPHLTPIHDPLSGAYGVLDHFVLERRDANGPRLPLGFGDVHTLDRLMAIPLGLQPCVQFLEVGLQVVPVVFLGDPLHTPRRVCPLPAIGAFEGGHITEMRQRVEPSCGFALRS